MELGDHISWNLTLYKNRAEIHTISQKAFKIMWRIPQLEVYGFGGVELKGGVLELDCCFCCRGGFLSPIQQQHFGLLPTAYFHSNLLGLRKCFELPKHWGIEHGPPCRFLFPVQTWLVSTCAVLSLWTDTTPKHKRYQSKFWRKRKHGKKKTRWINVQARVDLNDPALLSKNLHFSKIVLN